MSEDLPDEAYAIALALMPDFGPAKLRTLFAEASPPAAWASITGATSDARREMENQWRRHCDHGITVLLEDSALFPERLVRRQVAPPVLFCLGNPRTLSDKPTAAIIGTRSPTRYGIGVAAQLATELSAAGVSVVSGLALGIDGAAHEGACGAGAPPIGVVAGGLDEPYPMRHARLWERVSNAGVIVSEAPAGARAEKWRFPVRNRLMAALSEVVVVVESRHDSGSRHTVSAAVTLNIPVGAVPGSIRSATSEGTNELLSHCDFPVCSVTDILVCLARRGCNVTIPADAKPGRQPTAPVPASEQQLYAALTYEPTSLDELARLTGLDFAALCGGLERLAQAGFARDAGGWWERI